MKYEASAASEARAYVLCTNSQNVAKCFHFATKTIHHQNLHWTTNVFKLTRAKLISQTHHWNPLHSKTCEFGLWAMYPYYHCFLLPSQVKYLSCQALLVDLQTHLNLVQILLRDREAESQHPGMQL